MKFIIPDSEQESDDTTTSPHKLYIIIAIVISCIIGFVFVAVCILVCLRKAHNKNMDNLYKDNYNNMVAELGAIPLISRGVGDSTLKEILEDDCITSGSGKFHFCREEKKKINNNKKLAKKYTIIEFHHFHPNINYETW